MTPDLVGGTLSGENLKLEKVERRKEAVKSLTWMSIHFLSICHEEKGKDSQCFRLHESHERFIVIS